MARTKGKDSGGELYLPKTGSLVFEIDWDKRQTRTNGKRWVTFKADFPMCMRSYVPGHNGHCHYHFRFNGMWLDAKLIPGYTGPVECTNC